MGHRSQDRRDRLLLVPQPRAQSSLSATAGTPCAAVSSVASIHGPPAWVRPTRGYTKERGNATCSNFVVVVVVVVWTCCLYDVSVHATQLLAVNSGGRTPWSQDSRRPCHPFPALMAGSTLALCLYTGPYQLTDLHTIKG